MDTGAFGGEETIVGSDGEVGSAPFVASFATLPFLVFLRPTFVLCRAVSGGCRSHVRWDSHHGSAPVLEAKNQIRVCVENELDDRYEATEYALLDAGVSR